MPPLILVPGHLCGRWLYAPQMEAFPSARIADVNRDDTVQAMAARLLEDAPERFVVAGLSMGGMVAMEVMAAAPDRLLGACLLDTDPTPARPREVEWRAGLLAQGLDEYVETFVGRFYLHDAQIAATLGPETFRNMRATPGAVARAQAHALDTRREMAPLISGFGGPVEIVVGADDRVCPPKVHAPLAEVLPDACLTEIGHCGHIATLEHPDIVTDVLKRLMARVEQ